MCTARILLTAAGLSLLALVPVAGLGPSFAPDATFKASNLTGWHTLGRAEWRAQNGELAATTRDGDGWLVLDRSYEDVGVFVSYRCTGSCRAGILLRAEPTPQGMRGVYLSLEDADPVAYSVTLDQSGRELSRDRLRNAGGMVRLAAPADGVGRAGAAGAGGAGRGGGGAAAGARAAGPAPAVPAGGPLTPPRSGLRAGEWNQVEILLDANVLRWFLNETAVQGGQADADAGRYGPIALFAGGTGEVRFKDIAYKDLGLKMTPAEETSNRYRVQRVNEFYYSWSAAAADFNRDANTDIVSGPYIYFGPDFTTSREYYLAQTMNPGRDYPYPPSRQYPALLPDSAWVFHAADFTGDGWPDVLSTDHASGAGAALYVNPKGEARRWDRYTVVTPLNTEITLLRDVDGDGRPELVYGAEGYVRYARPDPANPTAPWHVTSVSERTPWGPLGTGGGHGLGVGDINGDGRMDITNTWGWFEQPATAGQVWAYHAQAFGRWDRSLPGGGTMAIYDVNGDGRNDVVTALQAHGFGLAWFEQKRDAAGAISFVQHMIMDDFSTKNAGNVTFSELHGAAMADIDGDRIPDFVVGKRHWAHQDSYYDPDPYGAAVLYWYRTVRNQKAPGGAEFVPNLIHNRSGVGSDVLVQDLNKDGRLDIVTATTRGTFVFWATR